MKVILKAISHPELGDIPIDDSLFPIGRQEAPFSAHQNDAVAKLSRRHARIFEQNGSYFLVDAGSLNGTWRNGKRLGKQAARLRHGDELSFAEQLRFRVELVQQQVPDQEQQQAQLSLIPTDPQAGLDTLVITRFPFLVSQTEGHFPRYQGVHTEPLKHLSRRHAHIFLKHNQPYVEDLGSTNGTFLGEQRLDEHAVALHHGDTLVFGSPTFSYRVALTGEEAADDPSRATVAPPLAAPDPGTPQEPNTIFITSASPFLDIFCQQQVPQAAPAASDADQEAPAASGPRGRWGRLRVFVGEFRQALGIGSAHAGKKRWLIAAALLLLALPMWLLYQRGAAEREIQSLMDDAQYLAAGAQANRHLSQSPGDDKIQALASQALLSATVPPWQTLLAQQAYNAAHQQLEAAAPLSEFNPEGQQLLALLSWITDLDQFFAHRPPEGGLVLFRDERRIISLLSRWENQGNDARRLLDLVRYHVPGFTQLHGQTFSRLRQLEYERSVYLEAIEGLQQRLQRLLQERRLAQLTRLLDEFEQHYPSIDGIDQLRADLDDWQQFEQVRDGNDLEALARLGGQLSFRTPPFQQAAQALLQQAMPPPRLVAGYRQAQQAWQAGQAQRAIALLQSQLGQGWDAAITRRLAHYQHVHEGYQALQANPEAADYGTRLIAFYGSLVQDQDRYYREALQPAFRRHADQAYRRAEEAMQAAERHWLQYRQDGGITSALRLEGNISDRFRHRAELLSLAHDRIREGLRLYRLLTQTPEPPWLTLQQQIVTEMQGQRQWLKDLSTVLEAPLLQAKLQLLDPSGEASQ